MTQNAFLGSNTPLGFTSFYSSLIRMEQGARLFILKGGSGSGKSTLMKKFAAKAEAKGWSAELYHCSSDVNSLDGVWIPERKMAIVDGTNPHIVDISAYGAFDEIVNLGDCIRRDKIKGEVGRIQALLKAKSECYATAYSYLAAAGLLFSDNVRRFDSAVSATSVYGVCDSIWEQCAPAKRSGESGFCRQLFRSALTPSGCVSFAGELDKTERCFVLTGGYDSVYAGVVSELNERLRRAGHDTELYCNPMKPDSPLALWCKSAKISVVSNSYLCGTEYTGKTVDFSECIPSGRLNWDTVRQNNNESIILLTFAYTAMQKAASYHQELEHLYHPAVDFDGINELTERVLNQLN